MQQEEFAFMKAAALLSPDEIYHKVDQELLESFEEDRRIERKSAGIHPKSLGDYFSLWANTAPDGGILVIGVADDGSIEGLSALKQSKVNDLERSGSIYCPDARYETKRVASTNQAGEPDFILMIRVYYNEAKVVETVSGEAYTRVGDSKKALQDF